MIIKEKLGNLSHYNPGNRGIDWLWLEWYETGKRILHKKTTGGREIVLKLLNETSAFSQGDVVYEDATVLIAIDIRPCEAIVVQPASLYQMAGICYEIGNKHLPIFYDQDQVLVPFELPLFRLLEASGFSPKKEMRQLMHSLKTTVTPHNHVASSPSMLSRILHLTSSGNE